MIDKQLLQKRFSKQAVCYDEYACVQKQMGSKLLTLAANSRSEPLRILEIGSGTGYLTGQLLACFPQSSLTAVDIAPGMIEAARLRLGCSERLSFICSDVEELTLEQNYDLIISNAAFQWFNHPQQTIGKLVRALEPDGELIFSTFGSRTFYELHESFREARQLAGKEDTYRAGQQFWSLNEWQRLFCQLGTEAVDLEATEEELTEYFPSVRAFLSSVKKIGANNSNAGKFSQSPAVFRKLFEVYQERFQCAAGIPATYHALYMRAVYKGIPGTADLR